jgi:hypothetical protein
VTRHPASLADLWDDLATVGLLGAERRPVPVPPSGPVASLVAQRARTDPGEAVLDQVAALVAGRRAGIRPGAVAAPLEPPPADPRPVRPAAAGRRLALLLEAWPELVDEWLARLVAAGYRLAPDDAVALLARTRAEPQRRQAVVAACGPLAVWLVELFPGELSPRGRRQPAAPAPAVTPGTAPAAAPGVEPPADLAADLPPDLAALVHLPGDVLADALAAGVTSGRFQARHRPLLLRLLQQAPFASLEPVAAALARAGTNAHTMGLALSLADFAATRCQMIQELLP